MRFLYKVLIGLIIFNGVLILFSDFFPYSGEGEQAYDVLKEGEEGFESEYKLDEGLFGGVLTDAVGVAGTVLASAVIIGILSHQVTLFVGVGAFIAVVSGLWVTTNGVLTKLANYPIVNGLVTIITIVIGILAVLTVVEIFTAQRGVD